MSECNEATRHAPHGSPGDWWCVGRPPTRYATPSLSHSQTGPAGRWYVKAMPYGVPVGFIEEHAAGWTATMRGYRYAGLWPTKQAAAEVLVKQAGYELELT